MFSEEKLVRCPPDGECYETVRLLRRCAGSPGWEAKAEDGTWAPADGHAGAGNALAIGMPGGDGVVPGMFGTIDDAFEAMARELGAFGHGHAHPAATERYHWPEEMMRGFAPPDSHVVRRQDEAADQYMLWERRRRPDGGGGGGDPGRGGRGGGVVGTI